MRGQVSESFANIPYNEWPDKELLESYVPRNYKTDDFAWGKLFHQALNWLNDRESKKRRAAKEDGTLNQNRGGRAR